MDKMRNLKKMAAGLKYFIEEVFAHENAVTALYKGFVS
jgi:hypothetical protein